MVPYIDLVSDTICAQITASGYAGVSVIRISGKNSLHVGRSFCPFLPLNPESHRAYFGDVLDPETKTVVDQCLVTCFKEGYSFTGDSVLEISCHGNPIICQKIIGYCLKENCRLAERGEFSFRAFYNGKIDLVQAESIHQLVMSQTQLAANTMINQLDGKLSDIYCEIEYDVVDILGQLEASIDFVEQDIEPETYGGLESVYKKIFDRVGELLNSYEVGKNLSRGWKVLLLGETNVGKSSLFNCFFAEDKAIVSEFHGTTRDLVHDRTFLGHQWVRFVDSAGLRKDAGEIEKLGMQKTIREVGESDIILWVFDGTREIPDESPPELEGKRIFLVVNKTDLLNATEKNRVKQNLKKFESTLSIYGVHLVSAKDNLGIKELVEHLQQAIENQNRGDYKSVVTQSRHHDHLQKVERHLKNSFELLLASESPDLVSQEGQLALMEIHKLLGKTYDDQILDKIFSSFCIGK